MALEVRYVGTRGHEGWNVLNYNEFNIVENGFLNEFRQAQANLQANIAAGTRQHLRLHRRARHGAAADVPRLLQRPAARPTPPTARAYTGTNWTNSTFLGFLARAEPAARSASRANADDDGLLGNATLPHQRGWPRAFRRTSSSPTPRTLGGAHVTHATSDDTLQLAADRAAPPAVAGLQFQAQLRLRQRLRQSSSSRFSATPLVIARNAGDPAT